MRSPVSSRIVTTWFFSSLFCYACAKKNFGWEAALWARRTSNFIRSFRWMRIALLNCSCQTANVAGVLNWWYSWKAWSRSRNCHITFLVCQGSFLIPCKCSSSGTASLVMVKIHSRNFTHRSSTAGIRCNAGQPMFSAKPHVMVDRSKPPPKAGGLYWLRKHGQKFEGQDLVITFSSWSYWLKLVIQSGYFVKTRSSSDGFCSERKCVGVLTCWMSIFSSIASTRANS